MNPSLEPHTQKIGYTRASLWSPFLAEGMVLRIDGDVPPEQVYTAVQKLGILHPALASRVELEDDGSAWLTTEGVPACSLEIQDNAGRNDWQTKFLEQEHIPFAFERGPIGRFFLLRGNGFTDLVEVIPHVLADGYAEIQLLSDLLALLNDPGRVVEFPEPFTHAVWQHIPDTGNQHLFLRGIIKMVNQIWPQKGSPIGQDEYVQAHRGYWETHSNGLFSLDLTATQTSTLVERCRSHGVKVTGAIAGAFLLAQNKVRTKKLGPIRDITIDVNIRDRVQLTQAPSMGNYSSNIVFTIRGAEKINFWELARIIQARILKGVKNHSRLILPLALGELAPHIADRQLLELSSGRLADRLGKLTGLIKFQGLNPNLDVSNIGQFNLPSTGVRYKPSGIFTLPPLWPGGGLALTATTINGKMNLTLKHCLDQVDAPSAARIGNAALDTLLDGEAH